MPDSERSAAETALRRAVTEGRHAEVEHLAPAYVRAAAALGTVEAATAARETIEWARRLVLARRAAWAAQLSALAATPRAYIVPSRRPTNTWEIRG